MNASPISATTGSPCGSSSLKKKPNRSTAWPTACGVNSVASVSCGPHSSPATSERKPSRVAGWWSSQNGRPGGMPSASVGSSACAVTYALRSGKYAYAATTITAATATPLATVRTRPAPRERDDDAAEQDEHRRVVDRDRGARERDPRAEHARFAAQRPAHREHDGDERHREAQRVHVGVRRAKPHRVRERERPAAQDRDQRQRFEQQRQRGDRRRAARDRRPPRAR